MYLTYFLVFVNSAFAASLCPSDYSGVCDINIDTAIGSLVNFAYLIAIIVALFYLIWAGIKWITSGGDKAALQQARDHLIGAIIGLVVVFLSYLILTLVGKFFLGADFSLSNITIPQFGQ